MCVSSMPSQNGKPGGSHSYQGHIDILLNRFEQMAFQRWIERQSARFPEYDAARRPCSIAAVMLPAARWLWAEQMSSDSMLH